MNRITISRWLRPSVVSSRPGRRWRNFPDRKGRRQTRGPFAQTWARTRVFPVPLGGGRTGPSVSGSAFPLPILLIRCDFQIRTGFRERLIIVGFQRLLGAPLRTKLRTPMSLLLLSNLCGGRITCIGWEATSALGSTATH